MPVTARVVRVHEKGETFVVGIQFVRIQKQHQKRINDMAVANLDCDTRLSLGLPTLAALSWFAFRGLAGAA